MPNSIASIVSGSTATFEVPKVLKVPLLNPVP